MQLIRRATRGPWRQHCYVHPSRPARQSTSNASSQSDGKSRNDPPSFLNLRGESWKSFELCLAKYRLKDSTSRELWSSTVASLISSRNVIPVVENSSNSTQCHRHPSHASATDNFICELASLLIGARHFGQFDLLSYLGISQGNWDAVSWIVKALSERPIQRSLESFILENGPLGLRSANVRPSDDVASRVSYELPVSKDSQDASPFHPLVDWLTQERDITQELQIAGLGQVWRSLGNFVLLASSSNDTNVSQDIMDQALSALAILHHNGIMPNTTYIFESTSPTYPFAIEKLSQVMLMAILDAEWNLNQSDLPGAADYTSQAQFEIPGFQFSDLHNPERILPYAHSIWLELILWACLKGRWVVDGMDILHRVIQQHHGQGWSIIPSHQLNSSDLIQISETSLSEDVILAYSRAILNIIPPSNLEAGHAIDPSTVMRYLHELKVFLANQKLTLPQSTLLNISTRVLTSSSVLSLAGQSATSSPVLLALRPWLDEGLLDIPSRLKPSDSGSLVPVTFDDGLSSRLLGMYHQLLRSSLAAGSCDMVIQTVKDIRNLLKRHPSKHSALPATILAQLLDFIVYVDPHAFGREILFGHIDSDIPLIPEQLEKVPEIIPSLLRYATIIGDIELSKKIALSFPMAQCQSDIKAQMMVAVMQSQVEYRHWDAIEELITSREALKGDVEQSQGICILVASLAKACLLLQRDCLSPITGMNSKGSLERACEIFSLAVLHHSLRLNATRLLQIHSILGMMSSLSQDWAAICRPLLRLHGTEPLKTSTNVFGLLLEGVLQTLPLSEAVAFWKRWCLPVQQNTSIYAAPNSEVQNLLVHGIAPASKVRSVDVNLPGGEVLTYLGGVEVNWRIIMTLYRCILSRTDPDETSSKQFFMDIARRFYGGEAFMMQQVKYVGSITG
jgi:hypothetical protein